MDTQTTVPCAQSEDSDLLGPLQSPNWVKVCLVSTVIEAYSGDEGNKTLTLACVYGVTHFKFGMMIDRTKHHN